MKKLLTCGTTFLPFSFVNDIDSALYWRSVDSSFFDVCSRLGDIFKIDTESLEDEGLFPSHGEPRLVTRERSQMCLGALGQI